MNAGAGLSGAASGAEAGSVAGPWGIAAGGLIGGAIGLFGGSGTQDAYQATNPYSTNVLSGAVGNNQQIYAQQQQLAQALAAQAAGQGPNPALNQLHQTTDQNSQLAAGLAASQRGLNPAAAARMAIQAQTNANQTAGGQAATLGAQQQLAAQGQEASVLDNAGTQQLQQQQLYDTSQAGVDKINAGVSAANTATNAKQVGGLENGAGAIAGMVLKSPTTTTTMSTGGRVPGRAPVAGDSLRNDIVKTDLSPGEIVIPRSHADNAVDAKDFIDHLMSQKKKAPVKPGAGGYGAVLAAHRALGDALKAVQS